MHVLFLKCTEQSDFGKCVLDELTGEAKQCVLNCLGKSEEPSVPEPTKEIVSTPKTDKNNFIDCLRKCVRWQTAVRIIIKCTEQSDFGKCVLDELTGEAKQCVLNCLDTKKEVIIEQKVAIEIVSTPKIDKNNFIDCLRKCVRWQTAVRIIIKCTEQSDFGKCVLDELTGEAKQCVLNCLDQSKSVSYETDCAEKVTKAREHFKKLSTEDKKTFLFAIAKKIIDKHPNVKKENVRVFLVALFGSTDEGEKVCELYKKLFETKEEKDYSECEKKVADSRKYFNKLNEEAKKKLLTSISKKLMTSHPSTPKESVKRFLLTLYSPRNIKETEVCELYDELFDN